MESQDYDLLSNFKIICRYCEEEIRPLEIALHLKRYHIEAYNYWRSRIINFNSKIIHS